MTTQTISIWYMRLTLLMALIMLGSVSLVAYLFFFQQVSPLIKQTFVSIEATSFNGHGSFIIAREFCLAWTAEASAQRIFRRIPEGGEPEDVFELIPAPMHLLQGCHIRPRTVDVPDGIKPGRYIYQNGLKFCSAVKCVTEWLPPVTVHVDTFEGRHELQIQPDR